MTVFEPKSKESIRRFALRWIVDTVKGQKPGHVLYRKETMKKYAHGINSAYHGTQMYAAQEIKISEYYVGKILDNLAYEGYFTHSRYDQGCYAWRLWKRTSKILKG